MNSFPFFIEEFMTKMFTLDYHNNLKENVTIFKIFMLLSRVDVNFLFWSLFPAFPRIQTVPCVCYSLSNFIGSYFPYSPRGPTFSDLFYMRFYWLFFR